MIDGPLAEALKEQDEKLMNCVHCGFCLPACPTYSRLGDENDSPRGRLYLMRAVVEGRLSPASEAFQTHMDRCLGCRACETVCPSGVEYGSLLERARESAVKATKLPLLTGVLLRVFGSSSLAKVALGLSRVARATGVPALLGRVLPEKGVLGQVRLGSGMLAASAPHRIPRPKVIAGDALSPSQVRGRVAVLTGCVQQGLFAHVNDATTRTLRANGYEVVEVPAQGCCGALHAHAGALDGARDLAKTNIAAFGLGDVDHVVVNAAGCGAVMKEYHELVGGSNAKELSDKVIDVSVLLAAVGPRTGASVPLKVTYDAPCHLLHGQKVEAPPLELLRSIPELELIPLSGSDECCGGAGIYGITHPELGGRIGFDKVDAIGDTGAEVVATGNPGCMMQIGSGLRARGLPVGVMHPVELLDESYRRAGFYHSNPSSR